MHLPTKIICMLSAFLLGCVTCYVHTHTMHTCIVCVCVCVCNKIQNININKRNTVSRSNKIDALKCWFSTAITGPFCITRALDFVASNQQLTSGALACETTTKIRLKLGMDKFGNFNIDYLSIIDNQYYLINGADADDFNFPENITYSYIEVTQPGNKYNHVPENVIEQCSSNYVDGSSQTDDDLLQPLVVRNTTTNRTRIKLNYGSNVFRGMHDKLMSLINGQEFNDWCTKNGLEIWNGRDEQSKLSDYRLLKTCLKQERENNQQLQKQITALKQQLERHKCQKTGSNSNKHKNGNKNDDSDER